MGIILPLKLPRTYIAWVASLPAKAESVMNSDIFLWLQSFGDCLVFGVRISRETALFALAFRPFPGLESLYLGHFDLILAHRLP